MKTLIVDDDPSSIRVLRRVLERVGHEVVAATDGDSAWERLCREDFRVVVSDWMMPGVDGLELCRRVRGRGDGPPYTYVILVTARSRPDDRVAGYEAGADDFLTKPLDSGELLARFGVARRIVSLQEDLHERTRRLEHLHAELQAQCARLSEDATCDALTGLKNRRFFRDTLDSNALAAGPPVQPFSVVMVDVDHFKAYNDSFGHPAGDAALCDIGWVLRENVRDRDLVARYGGEEFVLLLSGTDATAACHLCERLRDRIASRRWPHRPVTASFGVATSDGRTFNALQLVEEADRALYASKRLGRNRVTHSAGAQAVAV